MGTDDRDAAAVNVLLERTEEYIETMEALLSNAGTDSE